MKLRNFAIAAACASGLLLAGCGSSVAGTAVAEVASSAGGVASSSGASGGGLESTTDQSATAPSGGDSSADSDSSSGSDPATTGPDTASQGSEATTSDDSVVTPSGDDSVPESIPGLSPACSKVTTALTGFSNFFTTVEQNGTAGTITQAAVSQLDAAVPSSGLPAQVQTDFNSLKTAVDGAVGKSYTEFAVGLATGNALTALEDISTWISKNCT